MKTIYFDILLAQHFLSLLKYSTQPCALSACPHHYTKGTVFGFEHVHGTWNKVVQIPKCVIWIDGVRMRYLNIYAHNFFEASSVHNNQEVRNDEFCVFTFYLVYYAGKVI